MTLDLNKKLGQLFFTGFEGYSLTKQTKLFLETIQPGGIVLFECNIKDKKQVKDLIKEINNCLEIKPFIAVDQEGGSVERLRNICTSLPSVWGLSKIGLNELLKAHEIIADELKELGFNMVFGPVLDINSNKANPIIGTRSISFSPKIVSEYGSTIIELYIKKNIIPVAKHFPGHGDLNIDSHLSLPVLNKEPEKLNDFELSPFKKAIKSNVPLIMVGHIQLPKIEKDNKKPASLSKKIISDLLKKELGFKGLIITDELNMKGVTKNYPLTSAAHEAVLAGDDLLLFNWQNNLTLKAFNYLKEKSTKDKGLKHRIEESYKRIVLFKAKTIDKSRFQKTTASKINNHKIAQSLAEKVIHWVKKDLFFIPLKKTNNIEIIYPQTPKLREIDLKNILKEVSFKNYSLHFYSLNPSFKEIKAILKKPKLNSRKILISYDIAARTRQKSLILSLLSKYPELIVISVGLEYDLELLPEIKNFISAYAPNYVSVKAAFSRLIS